jgi:hydroxyethylthiazole kinase-like uncharacterized protein yjeF
MLRAGTAAAACVLRDFPDRLSYGVALFAGSGNNGGDAYIVAAQLARAGVVVRLHASSPPRTDEAKRAAALARPYLQFGAPAGNERVVVDGLLGTRHRGAFREGVTHAVAMLGYARDRGAVVVALDVPSGLDATTGEIAEGSVAAGLTLCFGSVKRGVLVQRAHAGRIAVIDIGLHNPLEPDDQAWYFADDGTVSRMLPALPWDAHKGTRGRLAIVGGAAGMAGAVTLSSRAALASGCGLAKAYVEAPGVAALQAGAVQTIASPWPSADAPAEGAWGDGLAIGPGLGRSEASRATLERALRENAGIPMVLDADALFHAGTMTDRDPASVIQEWTAASPQVVLTPHPGEFARLLRAEVPRAWGQKADALIAFAIRSRATVLLKGTPTLVATPDGAPPTVMARGTALLATGGSGDVLTGIIGSLLAGGLPARDAAVVGAFAHGMAAEIATESAGGTRGLTLEAVLNALPAAWRRIAHPATLHGDILSELPSPVI